MECTAARQGCVVSPGVGPGLWLVVPLGQEGALLQCLERDIKVLTIART